MQTKFVLAAAAAVILGVTQFAAAIPAATSGTQTMRSTGAQIVHVKMMKKMHKKKMMMKHDSNM